MGEEYTMVGMQTEKKKKGGRDREYKELKLQSCQKTYNKYKVKCS